MYNSGEFEDIKKKILFCGHVWIQFTKFNSGVNSSALDAENAKPRFWSFSILNLSLLPDLWAVFRRFQCFLSTVITAANNAYSIYLERRDRSTLGMFRFHRRAEKRELRSLLN